jgi:hypothetical protein
MAKTQRVMGAGANRNDRQKRSISLNTRLIIRNKMSTPAGKIQFLIFCTSLFIESIGLIMCDTGTPKDMIGSTNDRPVTNMIKTTLSGPKLNEAYLANRSIHIPPEPALDTMFGGLMEGM